MMRSFKKYRYCLAIALAVIFVAGAFCSSASAETYDNNNIMDDAVFDNYNSMSADQIDAFLNAFPNSCISTSSGFSAVDPTGYNPTDGFLYGSTVSAGKVIYDAAQAYQINPQVLLATTQKEQSLVSGSAGCNTNNISKAMGYGCPDGGTSYSYSGINLFTRNGTTYTTVSGICVNSAAKAGFTQQIIHAAWMLKYSRERAEGNIGWAIIQGNWDNSDDLNSTYSGYMTEGCFKRSKYESDCTNYDGYATIDGTSVHMDNGTTAALYRYTPHFSGNQNFFNIFTSWFGAPYAYVYNGLSYKDVFDPTYYAANNPDVVKVVGTDPLALFAHFVQYGMSEGRQASANFNVTSYLDRYPDLRNAFHWNLPAYYAHYEQWGMAQGRIATGDYLGGTTVLNGIDYSAVYNFDYYEKNNQDVANAFGLNDTAALQHFVQYGMSEGRQASADFNVYDYMNRYPDLRWAPGFGWYLQAYYMHYIQHGKAEGRIANVNGPMQYLTALNGIDYSPVYDFTTYQADNPDIKNAFGSNDLATLQHFIQYGMSEGRQASADFNVYDYRNRYPDLQAAFGDNLKAYYIHYIQYGQAEGRIGT